MKSSSMVASAITAGDTIIASVFTRSAHGIALVAADVELHGVVPSKLLEPGTSWRVISARSAAG
jgi:hypothetical protein